MNDESIKNLLSVQETATRLHVSRQVIYRLMKSGSLKGMRIGKRLWRIPEKDVEQFLEDLDLKGKSNDGGV